MAKLDANIDGVAIPQNEILERIFSRTLRAKILFVGGSVASAVCVRRLGRGRARTVVAVGVAARFVSVFAAVAGSVVFERHGGPFAV